MRWEERFQNAIKDNETSGCSEWTSTLDKDGYGVLTVDGKKRKAHRLAMELEGINIYGKLVMHLCDNPKCVNIKHLKVGTQKDNMLDMALKERGCNKLTREQVIQIRIAYASGDYTLADLALEYGVTFQHISALFYRIKRKAV